MASAEGLPAASFSSAYLEALSVERARTDHRGFFLALVASMAVINRVVPHVHWALVLLYAAHIPLVLVLLRWRAQGKRSYTKWRNVKQTLLRLETFLLPAHRPWKWAEFGAVPPLWHTAGTGAAILNAGKFAGSLLAQGYVPVLALVSIAHAVPLWLHLPLQLASTVAVMGHNSEVCASPVFSDQVSRGFMRQAHGWMTSWTLLVLPLPPWVAAQMLVEPADELAECRQVMTAMQVLLGFLLPTMLLARIEHQGFTEHSAKEQQRQHQERLQQGRQHQGRQHQERQWRQHQHRFRQHSSMEQLQSGSQLRRQVFAEEENYEGTSGSMEPHHSGTTSKVTAVDRLYAALLTGNPCVAASPGCVCIGLLAAAT